MPPIPYKRILLYVLILVALIVLFPTKAKGDIESIPVVIAQPIPIIGEVVIPSVRGYKPFTEQQIQIWNDVLTAFPDAPIMAYIALAESGLNPLAKNPGSSASGVFQILKSTWVDAGCEGDVFVAENNIKCAQKLYTVSGTTPWNPSKGSWGQYL